MINLENRSIILFDGVCNLCNNSVQFIIKRDKKQRFLYASLQSDAAQSILLQFQLKNSDFDSIILIENEKIYQKTTAILKIIKQLNGIWKLGYVFIIIPKFIRDFIYNIIAKNRYKWFGKREVCMIPTKELKMRFLE
ncbi:MAG: thiol-disulfide oxidoreductase DCC family protein [Flavobacteriaceae bacterium]|nr:thiol-disulfide oxidoreductase DCC family protein [Flavobacteriaceae bacterium]